MNRRRFLTAMAAGAAELSADDPGWPSQPPRDLGFDPGRLYGVRDNLASRGTQALLIIKSGRIALEWYAPGRDRSSKHYTASLAKALVGGTSLMVASSEGRIKASDLASKFIPLWRDDPRKSRITIRHLATHTSGIEDSTIEGVQHTREPGWKGRFWRREPDPFSVSIREAPVLFEPGTGNQYSNPGMAALAYCVTASLGGAAQADIQTLLRERVFREIGIGDDQWSIGYGRADRVDGLDLYANWGGGNFTPRAVARIGEWMMHGGEWRGRPVVPARFVQLAVHYAGMPIPDRSQDMRAPGSGLCWYTNFDGVWPSVPRDAFSGAGAGHQVLLVVPSLEMVVVRNGADLTRPGEAGWWTPVYQNLFEPLMQALGNPAQPSLSPYPHSSVVRGVSFAPENSVERKAIDSDNWPLTWADDGEIYTAYGDGRGFEPYTDRKLSLGFARVEGGAADFRGFNIRSASGEASGDGAAGAKASGMLMVGGVLYMWVRNVQNAQLLWSLDRARTWEAGFKFDRGFGSPCFLNFGKNYAGAPDAYVYVYSQQGPSAYQSDDGVLMARAHRDRLRERTAWTLFAGMEGGQPAWSPDIAMARPVFEYKGHCQRVDAVYHPATRRHLLVVGYGHDGGWGIYDAPKPWGPWSTVFHTEYWGLGETHGYRIPTKWIAPDGHDLALVFSGLIYNGVVYDAFCVRKMKFEF
jgi:CubicO group peptidase (beta-lactamase class C family)